MIERIHTSDVEPDADEVAIAGHVHEIRDLGGLVFLIVRDREGLIQIVFKEEREPELFEAVQDAGAEDVVRVVGKPLESDQAPGGVEIAPTEYEVIDEADSPLPLEISKDIEVDLSTRLDNRALDLRKPETLAVFTLRSKLMTAMESGSTTRGSSTSRPRSSRRAAPRAAPSCSRSSTTIRTRSCRRAPAVQADADGVGLRGPSTRRVPRSARRTSRPPTRLRDRDVRRGARVHRRPPRRDGRTREVAAPRAPARSPRTPSASSTCSTSTSTCPGRLPRITFDEALDLLETEFGHFPDDPTDLDTKGEKLLGQHFEEQGHPFFVVGYPDEKFYYMQDVEGRRHRLAEVRPHL